MAGVFFLLFFERVRLKYAGAILSVYRARVPLLSLFFFFFFTDACNKPAVPLPLRLHTSLCELLGFLLKQQTITNTQKDTDAYFHTFLCDCSGPVLLTSLNSVRRGTALAVAEAAKPTTEHGTGDDTAGLKVVTG